MAEPELNNKTPNWFKEWNLKWFNIVKLKAESNERRIARSERLLWGIFAAVVIANVAGHWHEEIWILIKHFCGI